MFGKVWKAACKQGDPVVILEAMKLETELFAPAAGVVQETRVKAGDAAEEDAVPPVMA